MYSNYVTCEVCGASFRGITRTHLNTHNISFYEYYCKFPTSPILNEAAVKRASELSSSSTVPIVKF